MLLLLLLMLILTLMLKLLCVARAALLLLHVRDAAVAHDVVHVLTCCAIDIAAAHVTIEVAAAAVDVKKH